MDAEIIAAIIGIAATIVLGIIGFLAKAIYNTLRDTIESIQEKIETLLDALKPIGEKQAQQVIINDEIDKTLEGFSDSLVDHESRLDKHEHRITVIESQHVINHKDK